MKSYKVVIVGDKAVGKTVYIDSFITGEFMKSYIQTIGVTVKDIDFHTSIGKVGFQCWDISGDPKMVGIVDGFLIGADCAIIMFDVTDRQTYRSVAGWYDTLSRVVPGIPVVLCGSKTEDPNRKVGPSSIIFHRKRGLSYYDISTQSNFNKEKPFIYLLNVLNKRKDIALATPPYESEAINEQKDNSKIDLSKVDNCDNFNENPNHNNNTNLPLVIPITFFDPEDLNSDFKKNLNLN
ncbi:ranB, RAN GTPase [Dictyostelium purpureum]|uniref:GTP-binding nuclear protein n=1 Tax=Dictyostelium purpureum TaxID=5786 RepID=F0ZCY9_DICPU|nr:ranB, RAN GTPase [Dictyostelium purpureum]EGC38176.1 ranB, RAN GTPase [Dictyostelium purpureum]|eukprot:XP_003285303.1 ranB, RAN GTPase [Dictyostelium purpureum]